MNALNSKLKMQNVKWLAVAAFFIFNFTFYIPSVSAQRACTEDAGCDVANGFRCVSNRCNLPPPIWNVAGTGLVLTGQNARLFLTGTTVDNSAQVGNLQIGLGNQLNSLLAGELAINWSPAGAPRLGRGFTIYDGDETPWFRVDADGGVSISQGLNVGNVTGAVAGEIRTSGNLTVGGNITLATPDATVDGLNLDDALTSVAPLAGGGITVTAPSARTRVISLLRTCTNDQILKWNDMTSTWACAADVVGAGGAGGTLTGTGVAGQLAFWSGASSLGTTGTVPWARLAFPGTLQCTIPDQYVRAIGADGVTCGTPVAGGGGGGGGEPLYTTWYNNGSPTITGALTVSGAISSGGNIRAGGDLLANALFSRTTGADNIWIGDDNDIVQVQGAIAVGGCLGPVVVGATAAPGMNGAQDGYRGVDALCSAAGAFPGSQQCSTSEVLESIHCGAIWTDGTKAVLRPAIAPLVGVNAWIANGAPSLPTPTNDCYGWTQTGVLGGQQSQGIVWNFSVQGGGGYARPCNEQNRVLCCR